MRTTLRDVPRLASPRSLTTRLAAAIGAVGAALVVAVPTLIAAGAPAGAAATVTLQATIDGNAVGASSDTHPIKLSPKTPPTLAVEVTNAGSQPVNVRTVRLEGRVMGLTFFAYDTAVGMTVAPGATESRTFQLDLAGLDGQATGLIPGSVKILDQSRHELAGQSMVVDVRGSLRSVYGLFGLAVLALTIVSFVGAVLAMARHRLSPNRWRRALRFLTPGLGLGLVIVFSLSAFRVWAPQPSKWLPIVIVAAALLFAAGYLSPTPDVGEEDELIPEEEDENGAEESDGPGEPIPTTLTTRTTRGTDTRELHRDDLAPTHETPPVDAPATVAPTVGDRPAWTTRPPMPPPPAGPAE